MPAVVVDSSWWEWGGNGGGGFLFFLLFSFFSCGEWKGKRGECVERGWYRVTLVGSVLI